MVILISFNSYSTTWILVIHADIITTIPFYTSTTTFHPVAQIFCLTPGAVIQMLGLRE
jgi:hypothetical protein